MTSVAVGATMTSVALVMLAVSASAERTSAASRSSATRIRAGRRGGPACGCRIASRRVSANDAAGFSGSMSVQPMMRPLGSSSQMSACGRYGSPSVT